jgi:hypothetical protein
MNYMFYEYIGSFIYNRCAILFCGVNAPSLMAPASYRSFRPCFVGWKREHGSGFAVLHFRFVANAINNVNNIKVVKWFKSLEHRLG